MKEKKKKNSGFNVTNIFDFCPPKSSKLSVDKKTQDVYCTNIN